MDEYIQRFPLEVQEILQTIRRLVKEQVPEAQETIAYQMPAFRRGKIFFYFAAFKRHIGIYPPVKGDAALLQDLAQYRGEKGNLKFPLNQPIPYELIRRVVTAQLREYAGTAI